jgi:hypothetical protein
MNTAYLSTDLRPGTGTVRKVDATTEGSRRTDAEWNEPNAYTSDLVACPRCDAPRGMDCRSLKNPNRASSVVHKEPGGCPLVAPTSNAADSPMNWREEPVGRCPECRRAIRRCGEYGDRVSYTYLGHSRSCRRHGMVPRLGASESLPNPTGVDSGVGHQAARARSSRDASPPADRPSNRGLGRG